jgi:indolepyruvate ferredoxin oxidoreductase alpha subunit
LRTCCAPTAIKNVFIVDPQDLKAMQKAVDDALATEPAAIITRRPCLLIKKIKHDIGLCDGGFRDKCRGCKMCLKVGCPAVAMKDGKATSTRRSAWAARSARRSAPSGAIERRR